MGNLCTKAVHRDLIGKLCYTFNMKKPMLSEGVRTRRPAAGLAAVRMIVTELPVGRCGRLQAAP